MEKKPTWRSTTFILVVVNILLTTLAAMQQYLTPQTAAIISTVLTAVFAACNAWIKVNAPTMPGLRGIVAPAGPVAPPVA